MLLITRAVHRDTKEIISIESVNSGLQKDAVCACCGGDLIAKKGAKKAHHFSHTSSIECSGAYETQQHLTAKEYFQELGQFPLPSRIGLTLTDYERLATMPAASSKS